MANKYKELLDGIEYSFSTIHLYEQCHYAFYNKKICGEQGVNNSYAEIGGYSHEINEKIFKRELTVDEALKEWIEEFDDHVFEYISANSKEKKYLAFCDYLAEFDETLLSEYEILEVETKLSWKIGKYMFVGYTDLLLRNKTTKEMLLIDHKSAPPFFGKKGKLLKAQEDNFYSYSHQMYMYCKPIFEKYGEYPKKIIWNHMFDNTRTIIDFNIEDYEKSLVWTTEIIKKIYKDKVFEPCQSYMMCNQLCNYRRDCEYIKE